MKYKVGYIIFVFFLSAYSATFAQVQFNFNGLGRAIVTSNKLDGATLAGDTSSPTKGLSGYALFDLQPNIIVNKNLRANAILRLRNPFGSFYGTNTAFTFRQFQILGRIGKSVNYEIGDIYLGDMTKYTMFNPEEIYSAYESDIHSMRRGILEYENFNRGNMWRLQGVQGKSLFGFNKGIKALGVNIFAVRTNATDDKNVADRIMAGTRIYAVQSDKLTAGINYVGMLDIPVKIGTYDYTNNVVTADAKYTMDMEKILLQINGEWGTSSFRNKRLTDDSTVTYADYVYEAGLKGVYKPAKVKLFAAYRYVGPQFSSPSAQTARLNVSQPNWLFTKIGDNTVNRNQTLYDRFTDEQLYTRSVSAVMYNYLPQYGNLTPFGEATPNRTGFTVGIGTDTSAKIINAEVRADLYGEVIGEGVVDKRKFTSIRGGVVFNFGDLLKLNRKMSINLGARNEMTKRTGSAPIDFNSMLIDAGGSFEVLKKFDILVGVKMLTAKGNEYLSLRNEFNLLAAFPEYKLDLTENIYSFGARLRFGERSYFTVNYNTTGYKETSYYGYNYGINQLFFNYTMAF